MEEREEECNKVMVPGDPPQTPMGELTAFPHTLYPTLNFIQTNII